MYVEVVLDDSRDVTLSGAWGGVCGLGGAPLIRSCVCVFVWEGGRCGCVMVGVYAYF